MGYAEYFNNDGCSHSYAYTNYLNTCSHLHANYYDCSTRHYDLFGSGTYYYNYSNCSVGYYNVSRGSRHYNYSNLTNYTEYNRGNAIVLSWGTDWTGDTLNSTYIAESIAGLKELRDNMSTLSSWKSQQNATVDVSTTSPNVGNAEFDDANPATPEFVEDNQYDALKLSLDNLWAAIKGDDDATTPGSPVKNAGDGISKSEFELLKTKTDELAAYVDPSYLNHINYSGPTPCATYPTDSNPTGAVHSNYAAYTNA